MWRRMVTIWESLLPVQRNDCQLARCQGKVWTEDYCLFFVCLFVSFSPLQQPSCSSIYLTLRDVILDTKLLFNVLIENISHIQGSYLKGFMIMRPPPHPLRHVASTFCFLTRKTSSKVHFLVYKRSDSVIGFSVDQHNNIILIITNNTYI